MRGCNTSQAFLVQGSSPQLRNFPEGGYICISVSHWPLRLTEPGAWVPLPGKGHLSRAPESLLQGAEWWRRSGVGPWSICDQNCFCDCFSDCMSGPCPFGEVQLQPSTSLLPTLNRTFIWDVKAHKSIGLELQFSIPRLRQIGPGESCPGGVTYSISGRIDATVVRIGTFCSNGTVSRIKMQEGVKMALHLPWFHPRNVSGFSIANRSSIKREQAPPHSLIRLKHTKSSLF